jgi:hypothetical protein
MDKKALSLMFQNIKSQLIDIDKLVQDNPEMAIQFIHNQYKIAENTLKNRSES